MFFNYRGGTIGGFGSYFVHGEVSYFTHGEVSYFTEGEVYVTEGEDSILFGGGLAAALTPIPRYDILLFSFELRSFRLFDTSGGSMRISSRGFSVERLR